MRESNLIENEAEGSGGEDLFPFFFYNIIDLTPGKVVDGADDTIDLVEDKLFHRDSAVGHDLFHFLLSVVKVLVELVDNLLDQGDELAHGEGELFRGRLD